MPRSLTFREMSTSILMSWSPPEDANILVKDYILSYGIGFPDDRSAIIDAEDRYYTLKDLR